VVDTLLWPLVLPTVVDDEHLATPAAPVLHGVWPHRSNLIRLLTTATAGIGISMDGGLPGFSCGPGVAILPKLVLRQYVGLHVTVEQRCCVCACTCKRKDLCYVHIL
jgi:hypothetical protein